MLPAPTRRPHRASPARLHHDRGAAAPRIAAAREATVAVVGDGLHATEEQVATAEPGDRSTGRLERPCADAGFGVYDTVLVVHPRRLHRLVRAKPVVDHTHDGLQDRRADPVRPGASQHQLGGTVAQHDRRGHHARHPPSRWVAVEAERVQILLAEHVVQVHAGAGYDDARARAARGGPGASSSSASEWAIRIPPADGGGLVSTSRPRYEARTGSRSTTAYAARSSLVSMPPPRPTQSAIARPISPP